MAILVIFMCMGIYKICHHMNMNSHANTCSCDGILSHYRYWLSFFFQIRWFHIIFTVCLRILWRVILWLREWYIRLKLWN
jgi:hypothetical protein